MEYLIDSDTIISLLKGKFELSQKVKSIGIENCFVSVITIAELFFGAENSDQENLEKRQLEVIGIQARFNVVSLENALVVYGKQKARLKKEGNLIQNNDLFIGSTAIGNDMIMVTGNTKHFERLDGIQLENWTKTEHNEFIS